jgi:outer membrane lipoprotein carrier protein
MTPKLSPLLLAFVILAAQLARAEPLSDSDVKNLLSRIRGLRMASPNVRADFQEEKRIHLLNKPTASSGKIWFQAPNKFRREVTGNSPSVTVSNGRDLWIYYQNFKSAEHYSLGKRSPVDAAITAINTALNFDNAENTFQIGGVKTPSGFELQLLPRTSSMKRMFQRFEMRISNDLFVQRTDMVQPNGDQIVTAYSNQTRVPATASTFEFAPPPGTAVSTPLGR